MTGGVPGNKGGTGRPRSLVRDDVLLSFDAKARQFLDDVVAGKIISKMRIPILATAKHLTCAKCHEKGLGITPDPTKMLELEVDVEVSASVNQRMEVAEMMAKYGLGGIKEVTVDAVRQRVNKTLDELQSMLSPEQYAEACKRLEPIWA